ncbi:hypothetical protein [Frankia sp. AgKG'84/4]|uniref:hypothetical protein n=1 Tax=Frankia sp. AgKG'84/4 TaxID=573490 RepID=UPI00200D14F7|nr:hypothetical protein [Frankia sp. AgKG'84/4]MCL9795313.1 hypothetical protein [Frankia sp. AgKG'84/4]
MRYSRDFAVRAAGAAHGGGAPARRVAPGLRAAVGVLVVGLAAGGGALLTGCSSSGSGASADVRITGCVRDADSHRAVVRGEVHNGSSKRSNYVIQLDVRANDSKIEGGLASLFRVRAGATETFTARPVGADVPSGTKLTCTVAHVGRIAAQ